MSAFDKVDPYTEELIECNMDEHERSIDSLNSDYDVPASHQALEVLKSSLSFVATDGEDAGDCDLYFQQQMQQELKLHFQQQVEQVMSNISPSSVHKPNSDDIMVGVIAKSMRHTERVARREHIKADRIERVNQFIVTLRREIGYVADKLYNAHDITSSLCRKEVWYDIGEPHPGYSSLQCKIALSSLRDWCDKARKARLDNEAAKFVIEGDLEELERSLVGMENIVAETRKINEESEVVASQLCKLLQ